MFRHFSAYKLEAYKITISFFLPFVLMVAADVDTTNEHGYKYLHENIFMKSLQRPEEGLALKTQVQKKEHALKATKERIMLRLNGTQKHAPHKKQLRALPYEKKDIQIL